MEKEVWIKHKQSLADLQQKTEVALTEGQSRSLSELIITLEEAESLGKPPSIKKVNKLAHGLFIGQHLQEPELVDLLQDISQGRKRKI